MRAMVAKAFFCAPVKENIVEAWGAMVNQESGRILTVRTIWQIDEGTDFPRFITLFPD
jgi:hypothetical protein